MIGRVGFGGFFLGVWLAGQAALAALPGVQAEMPSVEQVAEAIRGTDDYDTAARRNAAFERLMAMARSLQGDRAFRNATSAEEKALVARYGQAASSIQKALIESLPADQRAGPNSLRTQWYARTWDYQHDPGFNQALLERFFSPGFRQALAEAEAAERGSAARGKTMLEDRPPAGAVPARTQASPDTWSEAAAAVPPAWRWLFHPWIWLAAFGALFAWGLVRGLPFRLVDGDPMVLRAGGKRWKLHHFAGIVTDVQRWGEARQVPTSQTVTHHDGSQTTIHSSQVSVTNRAQVMVRNAAGRTDDIQLQDLSLAVAAGQGFAAIWALRGRKNTGPYVVLHNYDLGRSEFLPAVSNVVAPPFWPVWPLLGILAAGGAGGWIVAGAFVAWIAAWMSLRRWRRSTFERALVPRVLAAFPAPGAAIPAPGGASIAPA